ncbi:MAG: 3-keto-5-aminohexanoate cleavage protein [Alphaproteobacteria bacterium]|jgi:3-keto-5-aminohexanoate cleavage enzyme
MPQKKIIIEARINEYMMRDENPHVPWTPEEIAKAAADCRAEGASIVHYHVRNPDGTPCHDPEMYNDALRRIRAACDILVHPTLGQVTIKGDEARLRHIVETQNDPILKPDIAPIDMGSTNVDRYDPVAKSYTSDNLAYVNTIGTLQFFARRMRELGVKSELVSWTVPFTRTIEAFLDMELVDEPVYLLFSLTDSGIYGGHPGTIRGLQAHLDFLPRDRNIIWSASNKIGNLFGPAALACEQGGNIAVGLGDYAYLELGQPTNGEVIRAFAGLARAFGREPTTPAETRQLLGMA